MKVAGVRLARGEVVWADAGNLPLAPGVRVTVECHRGLEQGRVFITPDQLVGTAPVSGTITGVLPSERPESACDSLPGAGMPPLGATIDTPRGTGLVIRIDPVRGSAVVRTEDGVEVEVRDAGQE